MDTFERFRADLFPGYPRENSSMATALFLEIQHCYSRNRHYHTLTHIRNCLDVFDFVSHGAPEKNAIRAAIYYHDVVYDTKAKDNEERSADYAVKRLRMAGYSRDFCDRVARLVLATKHEGGLTDVNEQVLADVDLSELAVDWTTFRANTEKVRREYAHVSDEDFRSGRAAFLSGMLERKNIYYSRPFQFLFEARARENMHRSIADLLA